MSDDNIVDFSKAKVEEKSNTEESVSNRILNCAKIGEECNCKYCDYKRGAAEMVLEFMSRDMQMFIDRTGGMFASHDQKDILYKAILLVKEMEREYFEQDNEED